MPSAGYDPAARPRWATQSGPMLVIDGALHPAIQANGPSLHIRNGVGVADAERAWFAISEEPVSFGRLARLFRDVLGCRNALYLDGSVSSLWDRPAGRRDGAPELGPLVAVFGPRCGSGTGGGAPDPVVAIAAPRPNRPLRSIRLPGRRLTCACWRVLPLGAPPGAPTAPPARPKPAPSAWPPIDLGEEIAGFYRDRGFGRSGSVPGLKPEARRGAAMLGAAASRPCGGDAGRDGDPHRLTRADLLLSRAFAAYVRARAGRPRRRRCATSIPASRPARRPRHARRRRRGALARRHLDAIERINPAYDGLRRGLAAYRGALVAAAADPAAAPAARPLVAPPRGSAAIALAEFQRVHGLPATGRAGPRDRSPRSIAAPLITSG